MPGNEAIDTPPSPPMPCPFCGGRPALSRTSSCTYVYCADCGSEGPVIDSPQADWDAVEAWNRRAKPSAEAGPADEHPAEAALRRLASWLGAGGYNAPTVDAAEFEAKIRWGIENAIAERLTLARAGIDERAEFEKWHRAGWHDDLTRWKDGDYFCFRAQGRWDAWQARAALVAPPRPPEITDERRQAAVMRLAERRLNRPMPNDGPPTLLACPFCGSSDAFVERDDLSSCFVQCNTCCCRGPVGVQRGDEEDEDMPGRPEAIERWNAYAAIAASTQSPQVEPSDTTLLAAWGDARQANGMGIAAVLTFARAVLAERARQVSDKGRTPEGDDGWLRVPPEPTPEMLAATDYGRLVPASGGAQEARYAERVRVYKAMVKAVNHDRTAAR